MLTKKLIFVTGKGGTGKSTVSLYLARKLALMGRKTLLVELGLRSSSQYLAEMSIIPSYKPQQTMFGFDGALVHSLDCLIDYVNSYVKTEKLTKYFFDNPLMRTLLDVAPGLGDLAILGKLTSQIRNHGPGYNYDHIIIDSHSTGSFLSMLMAPQLLSKMVSSGPLNTQSHKISETLHDNSLTHTVFVGLFEKLPVEELIESSQSYKKEFNNDYTIVMNKFLPKKKFIESNASWSPFIKGRQEDQSLISEKMLEYHEDVLNLKFTTKSLKSDLLSLTNGDEVFHSVN